MKHLFILLLLTAGSVNAQNPFNKYTLQIKWAPLRLVDPVNNGIELSIEKNHKKTSTQASLSYLMPVLFTDYDNVRGFRLGIEEKYFTKTKAASRNYVSAELILSTLKANDVTTFFDTANNLTITDPFQIEKRLAILQFKIGKQFLWNRFVIDISAGAGIKYVNTTHLNRIYPRLEPRDYNLIYSSKAEGKILTLNIPAIIRIGFLL